MTGPSSNPRPRVDQLTDDMLDQLYAHLEHVEQAAGRCFEAAHEKELDRWRHRAEKAEAERDALIDERAKLDRQLTTMTDVARSNRDHVRAIVPELEEAQAAIARVRALAERWSHTSDRKDGPLRELRAALDGTT